MIFIAVILDYSSKMTLYKITHPHFCWIKIFSEFRQMFIVPDRDHSEAENQSLQELPNSEVHMVSVFKNAISGILEEVNASQNTLWLFCLLGGNNADYCVEFYEHLRPLAQSNQTIIMMFSFRNDLRKSLLLFHCITYLSAQF